MSDSMKCALTSIWLLLIAVAVYMIMVAQGAFDKTEAVVYHNEGLVKIGQLQRVETSVDMVTVMSSKDDHEVVVVSSKEVEQTAPASIMEFGANCAYTAKLSRQLVSSITFSGTHGSFKKVISTELLPVELSCVGALDAIKTAKSKLQKELNAIVHETVVYERSSRENAGLLGQLAAQFLNK